MAIRAPDGAKNNLIENGQSLPREQRCTPQIVKMIILMRVYFQSRKKVDFQHITFCIFVNRT